jgi:release factor glutamine methyltransferase
VASGAAGWLAPGGHLLSEISARQASPAEAVVTASGLAARVARSPGLDATVIIGRRPS